MALVFKTTVIESEDATSFKIKDASTGWGTDGDPLSSAIQKAVIGITGQHLSSPVYIDITDNWDDFLSSDGYEILAALINIDWNAFPDGYYEIKMYINTDGAEIIVNGDVVDANVDFSYLNSQGFMVWARNYWRKLPVNLDFDNFDYAENRSLFLLKGLIESSESLGAVGRSYDFLKVQQTVSEQLNLRGIQYEYAT